MIDQRLEVEMYMTEFLSLTTPINNNAARALERWKNNFNNECLPGLEV